MKPLLILALTLLCTAAEAAPLRKAQFTRILNDVKLVPEQQAPVPAKVGDSVAGKTAVTTGVQSRAELRFEDNTITRLGANCLFNLDEGSRTVDLKQGAILLQVPKQLGGARVVTSAITAVVTGTTVMVEFQAGIAKFIVLEGQMDVFRNGNHSVFVTLNAGDMLVTNPADKTLPPLVQVDLKRLKETSLLFSEKLFGALGNQKHLIQAGEDQQKRIRVGELLKGSLMLHNPIEFPNLHKRLDLATKTLQRNSIPVAIAPIVRPLPPPAPTVAPGPPNVGSGPPIGTGGSRGH